jgi:hypothetical protein
VCLLVSPGLEVLSFLLISSSLFLRVMLTYSLTSFLNIFHAGLLMQRASGSPTMARTTALLPEDCIDGGDGA